MGRVKRAAALGIATGLLGCIIAVTSFDMEQNIGLRWLFLVRGPIPNPPEAVVVSFNKQEASSLKQSVKPREWSRALHAKLIRKLMEHDVDVIVFDVLFDRERDAAEDAALIKAVTASKRVVLVQTVQRRWLDRAGREVLDPQTLISGKFDGMVQDTLVSPFPALASVAQGLAPFPLSKAHDRAHQFWSFFNGSGQTPTLPVKTLLLYALRSADDIDLETLLEANDSLKLALQNHQNAQSLGTLSGHLYGHLKDNPALVKRFLVRLNKEKLLPRTHKALLALTRVYSDRHHHFLNYYGPSTNTTTLSYNDVLNNTKLPKLQGKVVFVGYAEPLSSDQRDEFRTPFSWRGINLSGVEIATTAFTNLLNGHQLGYPDQPLVWGIVFTVGLGAGLLAGLTSGRWIVAAVFALGLAYYGFAQWSFNTFHYWLPIFIPLVVQLPVALLLGLLLQYLMARRERIYADRAVRYYVPEAVAQKLMRGEDPAAPTLVYGTCLVSDVEGYTTLAESLAPDELATLKNDYFHVLGQCVRRHQGVILDMIGDSMVCIWPSREPDRASRLQACLAALDMLAAVEAFNQRHPTQRFPTRIGLNAGWVAMGHVGGSGHFMYGVVGDIVNTASRIEGLSKHLGSRLLATQPVIAELHELLIRPVGQFLLKGKTQLQTVFEIVASQAEATPSQTQLCAQFLSALTHYQAGHWPVATEHLETLLQNYPKDGPSRFYLQRCLTSVNVPTNTQAAGIIRFAEK
jgi:adenylate cyclase